MSKKELKVFKSPAKEIKQISGALRIYIYIYACKYARLPVYLRKIK
jgi:hypothetical protein